ncbi:UvrD-helicase domain-containing protein [Brumimicrobium mesophilum]|uniref:UvrD-helicase domain-containing protein n=1 Tax=Brumimicrobium mesophilum TaxID=392717 RepID=UPI000D144B25|nr:UvrD-helicase domain-containing protein [Brumimicrobium mesophilum]
MLNETLKPLTIYSASAGSGKTFSLVQNYLKLTLGDNVSQKNFGKILAMTFTNKAAWEMKERVIQALDWLAFPERKTEKENKKAKMLLSATENTTGLQAKVIQERSKRVLSEILHNYEDFNILTIDKFSLRLIRTFSRDLDLQEDFEVTLDQNILLEQVIDELMSKLGKTGEETVTNLAINYAKSNADEGDKWNFRGSLIEFSKVLTNEKDQDYIQELLKKDFNEETYQEIKDELKDLGDQHLKKCLEIYQYFQTLGTSEIDYPGKSRGIHPVLESLPSRTLTDVKPPTAAIIKTLSGESIKPAHNVDEKLMRMMEELFAMEAKLSERVYTLLKIKSNFYNLALLKYISKELTIFKEKKNIIGIFEFGQRIAELLKKENAPYIYERLGNRYNHYLLDEFQDTSRLQWVNLIPLVHESMSNNYENLIVGDPKQAIYRFRNGLVEQFVTLPAIYNPDNDANFAQLSNYFLQMGKKVPLEENYRSRKNIVEFNNTFFKRMLEQMPAHFEEFYKDIHQNPKGADGGFVSINLVPKVDKDMLLEMEETFLLEKVGKCIEDGFDPGDICILTRGKKEGRRYAKYLIEAEKGYKIVSSDSLLVSSDASVGLCIDYLNLRRNSGNKTTQIKFATTFYRQQKKDPIVELNKFWKNDKVGSFDFEVFVIQEFDSMENLFFPYENLYGLGESFIALAELSELRNPYLHHLLELYQNYDLKFGPDIRGFLDDWNAKLKDSTIQMPENKDAIKIMTIHKSKGLEFPVVIIPNLSWGLKTSWGSHFVEAEEDVVLYSKLSKTNVPDYMMSAFKLEYNQLLLDELNILYVAFTRPSERLYVMAETKQPSTKDGFFTQINQPVALSTETWNDEQVTEKTDEVIKFGEEEKQVKETSNDDEETNFLPKDLSDFLWFPELTLQDEEALETEVFNEEQQFGNELHLVLSEIRKDNTIDEVISKLKMDGLIEPKFEEEIKKTAISTYKLLEEQDFAKNADQVLDEQDILISEIEVKRPDKIFVTGKKAVVVDFKTGEPLQKHNSQVFNYCKQLSDMGFEEIEGYLLYTQNLELKKVK